MKISPLAPLSYPDIPPIPGVTLATGKSNIRYKDRLDLLLMAFAPGTQSAGVLTQSKVVAAPVIWCRRILGEHKEARALVVNAGNANAFTGDAGMASVERVVQKTADTLHCAPDQVFMASTGVIGEPLPDAKITALLPELNGNLANNGWHEAARAIMTTDTFMKVVTRKAHIGTTSVTLNGFAKGSGMIAPDMATLLAFVFTDAAIPAPVLQEILAHANDASFNSITVDGDTSTNDTLLAFATGQASHVPVASARDAHLQEFNAAFTALLTDLAVQVVRDGEGAQKLVTVEVVGAASEKAARAIALTIANSPLVKTAIAGEDANWGRIVAAAGRAGEELSQEKIEVRIAGILIARDGARVQGFDETPVAAHMKGRDIRIALNLNIGKGRAVVYTCDLTHGYIDINGSYRS
jgi:glutamate N-acetyltransferase/amino-acid N-acetyltransferase